MKNRLLADIQRIRLSLTSRMSTDFVVMQGALNQIQDIELRVLELKEPFSIHDFRNILYIIKNKLIATREEPGSVYARDLADRVQITDVMLGKVQDIINETGEVSEIKKILTPEDELKFRNFIVFEG